MAPNDDPGPQPSPAHVLCVICGAWCLPPYPGVEQYATCSPTCLAALTGYYRSRPANRIPPRNGGEPPR